MGSGKGNQKRVNSAPGARPVTQNSIRDAFNSEMAEVNIIEFNKFVAKMGAEKTSFRDYYLPGVTDREFNKNIESHVSYIFTECIRDIIDQGLIIPFKDTSIVLEDSLSKLDYNDYEINYTIDITDPFKGEQKFFNLFDTKQNKLITLWGAGKRHANVNILMGDAHITIGSLTPLLVTSILFERTFRGSM